VAFAGPSFDNRAVLRVQRSSSFLEALALSLTCSLGCAGDEFSADSTTAEGGAAGGATSPDAAMSSPADGSPRMGDAVSERADAGMTVASDAKIDVAPVDIPTTGLALWLSADVGIQVVAQRVSGWSDRSGLGRNAAQVVAEYRPVVNPAWHGGKSAVFFDGANRFLSLPAGFADFSQGFTILVVAEILVDGSCPSFLSFSNGGEMDDLSLHRQPGDAFEYEVADESFPSLPAELPVQKPSLMTVVHHSDSKVDLYSNGALSAEKDMMLPLNTMRVRNDIGRSSYVGCELLNGNIAEILVYARGISETERLKVEAYLRSKWML
jgi:hypothetical protein